MFDCGKEYTNNRLKHIICTLKQVWISFYLLIHCPIPILFQLELCQINGSDASYFLSLSLNQRVFEILKLIKVMKLRTVLK
jgi:hypothetical protein